MSQQQHGATRQAFGEKSDTTLWICLAVGFALVGAMGFADWSSRDSATESASQPSPSVQAKAGATESVYQCADGRVSFTPCS